MVLGIASRTRAAEEAPAGESKVESALARAFDPPGIDYPAAQAFGVGTSLYVDQTNEATDDLSTFSWVTGHGDNFRTAIGGTLAIRGLRVVAEIPLQYTRLHIDTLQGVPTANQDRDKSVLSLGDVVTGASYLWEIPGDTIRLQVGASLRARLPTHTTQFSFTLSSGYVFTFGFPYYLHIAPGIVLVAASKYLTLRIEETLLSMFAVVREVKFDGIPGMLIPDLYFWESHYAAIAQPIEWFGFSVELVSCIQLNRVQDGGYTTLHDVKALMLEGGPAVDVGAFRASVMGRLGLTHGAQDFGVITFSGTRAILGRVSYVF
jgi:hypothetical protein